MIFDQSWMERWQSAVNSNRPMVWIGKHFTARFLLGCGQDQYVVSFRNGKLDELSNEIGAETCYQLAIKGPRETWEKFCQPTPPPMYNDLWAMAHPLHGRLTFEGDQKILWQNMRAFFWALDLMREI